MHSREIDRQSLKPASTDAAGSGAIFSTLYAANSRRIYAICFRMLGDPDRANDALQSACLKQIA